MRTGKRATGLIAVGRVLFGAGLGLAAACGGYPDGMVVVKVSGLVSSITALQVNMKLDAVTARNPEPTGNLGATAFVVYDGMQRFGVQVPQGTGTLCLCIKGNDTNLQVVSSGTAVLDLSAAREVAVTLGSGTTCDVATLVCPAH